MKILKSEEVTIQKITIKPQNIWQRRDFKILIPSSNRGIHIVMYKNNNNK